MLSLEIIFQETLCISVQTFQTFYLIDRIICMKKNQFQKNQFPIEETDKF